MDLPISHHQQGRTLEIWVSGNLSGVGDGFPNTSLVLVEHGYNVGECFLTKDNLDSQVVRMASGHNHFENM